MDVYVRAPMFCDSKALVRERVAEYHLIIEAERSAIQAEFNLRRLQCRSVVPGKQMVLEAGTTITFPSDYASQVPKGLAIRLELLSILNEIDKGGNPRLRDESVFIQIDGSGAFHYPDSIRNMLAEITQNAHWAVIFGLRPEDSNWGMGPGRKQIELYEMFLIEKLYKDEIHHSLGSVYLPDAQAGCWAMRLGMMKEIPLTAQNYGLEFDLITSVLKAKLPFGFARVVLGDRVECKEAQPKTSGFNMSKHAIEKARLIQHKLNLSNRQMSNSLDEYLCLYGSDPARIIPPAYIEAIRSLG